MEVSAPPEGRCFRSQLMQMFSKDVSESIG